MHALFVQAQSSVNLTGHCYRAYTYHGRQFSVDSNRKLDAEGLRPVLKNNSESLELLNRYQDNLYASWIPAYTGTLGILMLIGGPIYANQIASPVGQHDTRKILVYSGISVIIGGYFFGQWSIKRNERRLEKAIDAYNRTANDYDKLSVGLAPNPSEPGARVDAIIPF